MRGPLTSTAPRARRVSVVEPSPWFVHERRPARGDAGAVVDALWTMQAARCRTRVESALPDDAAEIYLNLGPNGRHAVAACDVDRPPRPTRRAAWVVGPRATPLLVAKETEDCDVVGVRLRAGTVARVLGVPATEIAGALVDLDRLWAPALVDELRDRLAAAPDAAARFAVVERALLCRLARGRRDAAEEARTCALCAALGSAEPRRVTAVAAALGLTHRQVIARFDRDVGLKPRAYHRVARFRRALDAVGASGAAGAGARPPWARIAAQAGYCDQAHLGHEFRALAGMTPGDYAAARSSVGDGFVPVRTVADR